MIIAKETTMQIREFNHPVTSKTLNESLGKQFGLKLKLENFSDAQLEDARNKLRTKISQFEMNESFDSVLENTDYQKTRMLHDVINQEILEREMTSAEKSKETEIKKKVDPSGMKKSMQKQYGKEKGKQVYFATIRKRAMDESVPESWINSAIKRIELGESDRDELKAELAVRYDLNESKASWILMEGEEQKAEIILATKDMIDRITGCLDDLANMKAEQLLDLLDSIRAEMGSDVAEQYSQQVKPALDAIYTAIESSRQGLGQGLGIVSGDQAPTMGAEPEAELGGELEPPAADLGAVPPAAGEEELPPVATDAGREKRESIDYSRRLSVLLNSKKK